MTDVDDGGLRQQRPSPTQLRSIKLLKSCQSNLINESDESLHSLVNGMSPEHFGGMHNLPQSLPQSLLQNLPHLPNHFGPNALSPAFNSPHFHVANDISSVHTSDNDIESSLPWLSQPSEQSIQPGSNLQPGSPAGPVSSSNSIGTTNPVGSQLIFPDSWLVDDESEQSNSQSSDSSDLPSSGSSFSGSASSNSKPKLIKLPPNILPLGFNPSSSNRNSEFNGDSGDDSKGQIIIGTSNITSPYFYNVTSGKTLKHLRVSLISF